MKAFLFTCFAVTNIFAQQSTGSIVYKQIQPVENKIVTDNPLIRDAMEHFTKASLKIDFTVNFNKT